MAEADAVPLHYTVTQAQEVPSWDSCEFLDLWFTGMEGARLFTQSFTPAPERADAAGSAVSRLPRCVPLLCRTGLLCRDGHGADRHGLPRPGRVQRGRRRLLGTTVSGHIVAGLDGPPRACTTCGCIRTSASSAASCGSWTASTRAVSLSTQRFAGRRAGSGLCGAEPGLIDRAAILYPFLSDFKLVWDLGADEIAYEGCATTPAGLTPTSTSRTGGFRQLGYIDSKNFAPMVRCPVLFGTGLDDVICPPQTQCAVYNNLHCARKRYLFPGYGHEEIRNLTICCWTFSPARRLCYDHHRAKGIFAQLHRAGTGPADFAQRWQETAAALHPAVSCAPVAFGNPCGVYERLTVTLTGAASRPVIRPADGVHPLLLMYHDLNRGVRGWHHITRFSGAGLRRCRAGGRAVQRRIEGAARTGGVPPALSRRAGRGKGRAGAAVGGYRPRVHVWRGLRRRTGAAGSVALPCSVPLRSAESAAGRFCRPWSARIRRVGCSEFRTALPCRGAVGHLSDGRVRPPKGQAAIYNRLTCPKQWKLYPKYVHERVNFLKIRCCASSRTASRKHKVHHV